jgi:hypothetical protein
MHSGRVCPATNNVQNLSGQRRRPEAFRKAPVSLRRRPSRFSSVDPPFADGLHSVDSNTFVADLNGKDGYNGDSEFGSVVPDGGGLGGGVTRTAVGTTAADGTATAAGGGLGGGGTRLMAPQMQNGILMADASSSSLRLWRSNKTWMPLSTISTISESPPESPLCLNNPFAGSVIRITFHMFRYSLEFDMSTPHALRCRPSGSNSSFIFAYAPNSLFV